MPKKSLSVSFLTAQYVFDTIAIHYRILISRYGFSSPTKPVCTMSAVDRQGRLVGTL